MRKTLLCLTLLCFFSFEMKSQLNLSWQNVGPDNFGGPVFSVLIDKRDATRKTVYAGVFGGGVWKSTNGGDWWYKLDCTGNHAVSCLAQSPDGTIYYGTGGPVGIIPTNPSSFALEKRGNGIYKLDASDLSVHLASTTDTNNSSAWIAVNRIAINPLDKNKLLAATGKGLYQSSNAGNTWSQVVISGALTGQPTTDVKWSNDGNTVFATIGNNSISMGVRLLVSKDGGGSWQVVPNNQNGFPTIQGRIEVAISPQNSSVVYVSIATATGNFYGLYKSTDRGDQWTQLVAGNSGVYPFGSSGQGWFDNAIAVSPGDSDKIYFGGVGLYSFSSVTGTDSIGLRHPEISSTHQVEQFMYAFNDLNPDEMYIATLYGVFKSFNALSGFPSPEIQIKNAGLQAMYFFSVAAHREGNVMGGSVKGILIGDGKSKSFEYVAQSSSFAEFSQLDTNFMFIHINYTKYLYRFFNVGNSWLLFEDTILAKCSPYTQRFQLFETKSGWNTSDSVSFTALTDYSTGDTILAESKTAKTKFPYVLNQPLTSGISIKVPDPVKARLFVITSCGIYLTNQAIDTVSIPKWFKLGNQGSIQYLDLSADGNTLYASGSDGKVTRYTGLNFIKYDSVYGTTNSPIHASNISTTVVASNRNIEGIAVDPENDSVVIVTVAGYSVLGLPNAYKTMDAGATWTPVQIGPVGLAAFTCLIDIQNSNNYIAGTEKGIWISTDAGQTWNPDNSDMCEISVNRLRQIPLYQDECPVLYAATGSRGLWRSFSLTPGTCDISIGIKEQQVTKAGFEIKVYPNPSSEGLFTLLLSSPVSNCSANIIDVQGRVLSVLKIDSLQTSFSLSHLPDGIYFLRLRNGDKKSTIKLLKM